MSEDTKIHEKESKSSVTSDSSPETTPSIDKKKKKEKKPKQKAITMMQLFRFATTKERFLIVLATFFSIAAGALQPFSILVYGTFLNSLTTSIGNSESLLDATLPVIHIMAYIGTGALVSAYVSSCLWIITGENQTRRIRSMYLHSILNQDMGWFDGDPDGSLNTRLASDTQLIQDGISEKFGQFITLVAQFTAGVIVAMIKGWQMALIMASVIPILFLVVRALSYFITKYTVKSQNMYAEAGSIAEQAFQSIRTVYAFTIQTRFLKRYQVKLEQAFTYGRKRAYAMGGAYSTFFFCLFSSFGLALWYGSGLVAKGHEQGSSIYVVFMAMMMGSMSFLRLSPNLSAVSSARGAAFKVFEVIDRVPIINPASNEGESPSSVKGSIEFNNVNFEYPTRPGLPILKDFSLKIEAGKTVAFVGPSGSGKSTTVQLIQRFYDALSGKVMFDGHDVKELNVHWLREQIGVVGQEPVLFHMTIRQNLLMGTQKTDVPDTEIIAACKEANCHTFITQLPKGYDTLVGEQGLMLSGGQKQRIAIARAILKNPTILLLDEATSALDTQSERLVQNALDKASTNRTTVVVAHRLSTIINADVIVVIDHGVIIEKGTHRELIGLNGVYADLVKKQAINTNESNAADTNETAELNAEELLLQEQLEIKQKADEDERLQRITTNLTKRTTNISIIDEKEGVVINETDRYVDAYDIKIAEEKKAKKLMSQQKAPVWTVFKKMRAEWPLLAVGLCGSALAGCAFPLHAFSLSHVVVILSLPGQEIQPSPLGGTNLYAFLFVIIGICAAIGNGTQFLCYEICGESFSKRLRGEVFGAYLKQEVGFFDEEENSTGSLTTKLAVDARNVTELVTRVWGDVIQLTVTVIVGLVIAFNYSWSLTLITLAMTPFQVLATAYEFRVQRGFEDSTKKAYAQSSQVAGEAIREVRTVAGLNKQSYFEDRYYHATERPHQLSIKKAYTASVASGLSKGINIYTSCLAFYSGARLISNGSIDFQQMFTSMSVVMTTAEATGRASTFVSTFTRAKFAAIASFDVINRKPHIDPELEGDEPKSVDGDVDFKDIKFAYPARPDNLVFDGKFNFHGTAGQTIALVGPSGCGKSTTIGMIQRWYDSLDGDVSLDNKNVKSYSLYNLRSHMALVGQEPVLFDMTIGENVRFGIVDGKEVSQEEVENACKASNIHPFISDLPEGYNTRVGDKGSQISGGQKQRIAIARALIRRPRLLLLDEATSALDSDSERIVQKALDNIIEQGGRTTITIAHRLSTIQNADMICVVKDECVVEKGTHWELLQLNGIYSDMVRQQSLSIL